MLRMTFFFLCSVITFLLTCSPQKCGTAGYIAGIIFCSLCGMGEVCFFHGISEALNHTGLFVFSAGLYLGFQWVIWCYIRPQLARMYTIITALILLFSL